MRARAVPGIALAMLCGLTVTVVGQGPAAAFDKPVQWVGTLTVKTWQQPSAEVEYWHETTYELGPDAAFTNQATWTGKVHYSVKSFAGEPCAGLQSWTFYDGTAADSGAELDAVYAAELGGYTISASLTIVPVDVVGRLFDPCTGAVINDSITPSSAPGPSPNGVAPGDENSVYLEGEFVEGDASLGGSTKWSLRRVDCDLSVDTDGGGVGDCLEFDAGTDRLDPADDVVHACNDGLDNDGDGGPDSQDPGCSSPTDDDEHGNTQCDNGADDDSDGLADTRDPGCTSPSDDDEHDATQCNNDADDDGDGLADTQDPGCTSPADDDEHGTTQCDNGADDDGDHFTDMNDPDCPSPAWDQEEGCAANQPPANVGVFVKPVDWRHGQDRTDPKVTMTYSGIGRDPEGQNLTWMWRFTDSHGTEEVTGQVVTHQWDTSGGGQDRVATVTAEDPCGAQAANGLKVWVSGDPVRDFAPTVGLYPEDPYKPMSAQEFINGSTLKYRGIKRRGKLTPVESHVTAAELGKGSLSVEQPVLPDLRRTRQVATDDWVRPWDDGNVGSRIGLKKDGFALDLANGLRGGDAGNWPVYVQESKDKVVYWQFYGASRAMLRGKVAGPLMHEGDWERIIVDLNGSLVPTAVGYVAHHFPVDYDTYPAGIYSTPPGHRNGIVDTDGLSPRGYSALQGHGTYPTTGKTCVGPAPVVCDYRSDDGPTWVTRDRVVDVSTQAWFGREGDHAACRRGAPMPRASLRCGYGGAWGQHGSQKGAIGPDTTGPMGPSTYKSATTN